MNKTLSFEHIPHAPHERDHSEPFAVNAVVETPAGSRSKYAYHEEYGIMTLTATMRPQLRWPCDFGFIPQTREDDGDPIDVALFLDEPAFPSCLVYVRLIGSIGMARDGVHNDRLVGVMLPEQSTVISTDEVRELSDLPAGLVAGLETFLRTYPSDGEASVTLTGWKPAAEAYAAVKASHERWRGVSAQH